MTFAMRSSGAITTLTEACLIGCLPYFRHLPVLLMVIPRLDHWVPLYHCARSWDGSRADVTKPAMVTTKVYLAIFASIGSITV